MAVGYIGGCKILSMAETTIRDYYKILVIGPSGTGKTFSLRELDRAKTGLIDVEDKPLPFDGAFKYRAKPRKFAGVLKALEDYAKNPEIELIVLESLSMTFDKLLEEMRTNFKGFDIWSNYGIQVAKLMSLIKSIQKDIVITGHYEILNIEGNPEKRFKVHGKEHEGKIEYHFTIVLYSELKFKDDKPEYYLRTVGEGMSAKCPPAIFEGAFKLPSNIKTVVDKVVAFAKKGEVVVQSSGIDEAGLFS